METNISNPNRHGLKMRWALVAIASLVLGSCSKKGDEPGNLQIALSSENFILIDAKAYSCKSRNSATQTEDVSSLYTDLGRFSVTWTPPSADATLKIIYIKVYPRSSGLASSDPKTIAGQDLNCLVTSNIDGDSTLPSGPAGVPITFTFPEGQVLGEFAPQDATKRNRFQGRADVLVYALLKIPGQSDQPITARTSFNFQFDGIF